MYQNRNQNDSTHVSILTRTGAESEAILSKVSAKISTFFAANPMIDFRSRCKTDRIYLIVRRVCINFYPFYTNNIVVFNETA